MSLTTANVTTSTANAYVSSGNSAVTWFSLCNYSAGNATANVYVVPFGGTPSSSNQIIETRLIVEYTIVMTTVIL